MCPICITTAALVTMAGSGSTGGLAAFVAVKLHRKRHEDEKTAAQGNVKRTAGAQKLEVANETRNAHAETQDRDAR